MLDNVRRYVSHGLFRQTVLLQMGSVGAMVVQAVAGIVLARILGPSEYGRFAIVMAMAAVGSIFLGAGAADAMAPVLTRAYHAGDDSGVRDALLFLGKFVMISSAIVCIIGVSAPFLAGNFYHDRMLGWLALTVLFASSVSAVLFTPAQLSLQVSGHIKSLSALIFTDQTVRQALVVGFAFFGFGILGASFGHLFGALLVMLVSAAFWWRLRAEWRILPSIHALWTSPPGDGIKYIRPTLWVLGDRNLAMLYGAAPVALAALFLTTTDISYFKIALGWVMLALAVLSPVSVLLNTELARIQVRQPERLRSAFIRITGVAVIASSFVTLLAAMSASPVFRVLYGPAYSPAVSLVYLLIPFGALFGLGIALGPMWRAVDRVKVSIAINMTVLGVGVPLGLLSLRQWGVVGAIGMVTLWYTTSHLISFYYLMRLLNGVNRPRGAA